MATPDQLKALHDCYLAAVASGHIFPEAAASEAAVETGWFKSSLYIQDMNVFGTKQHSHPIFETANLPTREFLNNQWVTVDAAWVKYPSVAEAFKDRMATLTRLAPQYPHYAAALAAKTPEEFINQVSITWSTGPQRAEECVSVLHSHADVLKP